MKQEGLAQVFFEQVALLADQPVVGGRVKVQVVVAFLQDWVA